MDDLQWTITCGLWNWLAMVDCRVRDYVISDQQLQCYDD